MKRTYTVKTSTTAKTSDKKSVTAGAEALINDDYIMGILREMNGLDEDDNSEDDLLLEDYPTKNDIFDVICDYEGLSGYGETIREWVFEVYNIDLSEID